GDGPSGLGRAFGFTVLGIVIMFGTIAGTRAVGMNPLQAIGLVCLMVLVGGAVASRGWPALGKVLFVYALAARVPVAALMLPAVMGHWGTHYDALPPNWPPTMGPVQTWALIGLFPQMTLWIGFTLIGGMLAGSVAAAAAGGRRRETVASAA